MLKIENNKKTINFKMPLISVSALGLIGGLYVGLLYASPNVPKFSQDITPVVSAAPSKETSRLTIPAINISISLSTEKKTDETAYWINPAESNPEDGGIMKVTANDFSLKSTPGETVAASPFYNLDKLNDGDNIIIDYKGKRYGYKVSSKETDNGLKLGLNSGSGKSIFAEPLGQVQIKN